MPCIAAGQCGPKKPEAPAIAKRTPPETALRSYVRPGARAAGGGGADAGLDLEPEGQLVRLGTDAKAFRAARRGFDRGDREPGGLDRRAGEELARLECQFQRSRRSSAR